MHRVRYAPPAWGAEEASAAAAAVRAGRLARGALVARFEAAFAERFGVPACLALGSGTAALHLAVMASRLRPGDEVVTTPLTFVATANVIEHVGARAVFVDVEPETLGLDPERIEAALSPRTRGVLPVHFAGHPCRIAAIRDVAAAHGLFVVEDAAHALTARVGGRFVGAAGATACFSFHETKNLAMGEGGLLAGSEDLVARARPLARHGMVGGAEAYDVPAPGWKYDLTETAAALGLAQLARLDALQARRRAVWQAYDAAFAREEALETPPVAPGVEVSRHMYLLRLAPDRLGIDRDGFCRELEARGIETSVHFIPLHTFSYYRDKYGHRPGDFPVAMDVYRRMVGIPMHPGMTDDDVGQVVAAVREVVAAHAL